MTWMDEFRNESDAILDQMATLRTIADAARMMGNKDLGTRLENISTAASIAAEKIDELVSRKVDKDYQEAVQANANMMGAVLAVIGPKDDGNADRKSV
jgi:hypothetical protein